MNHPARSFRRQSRGQSALPAVQKRALGIEAALRRIGGPLFQPGVKAARALCGIVAAFCAAFSAPAQSATPGFTNFLDSYGILETVAGSGAGRTDDHSFWKSSFEGGPATNAALSRPHFAMADSAGNIFIVDKNSHSVLRVDTNGLIHTLAGTHAAGFNGDGPAPAASLQLNAPNGLWVRADGTVYILDSGNARVRRVATNGVMTTLFQAKAKKEGKLAGGRCLWVNDDESLAYFGNKTKLRKWTPGGGVQTFCGGFTDMGCFCALPSGDLIVADRGANRVFRVAAGGVATVIAGNGASAGVVDGAPALDSGFFGPRGVWPAPGGGYLLLLHDGAQLWLVDDGGQAHLLVNGRGANAFVHAGDGAYFYAPDKPFIGEGRSVTVDGVGNILICESDYGFVRRIRARTKTP